MKTEQIRVGVEHAVNRSELNKFLAFDLLYGGYHQFVHVPNYNPWLLVNGSWTGALGHLMNDNRMDWREVRKRGNWLYLFVIHLLLPRLLIQKTIK
jgi:hypothetical protein